MGHVDSFDFVRAKLREFLASALSMVGDEQPKKYVKAENNFQIDSTVLNRHASEDYKVVKLEDSESSTRLANIVKRNHLNF